MSQKRKYQKHFLKILQIVDVKRENITDITGCLTDKNIPALNTLYPKNVSERTFQSTVLNTDTHISAIWPIWALANKHWQLWSGVFGVVQQIRIIFSQLSPRYDGTRSCFTSSLWKLPRKERFKMLRVLALSHACCHTFCHEAKVAFSCRCKTERRWLRVRGKKKKNSMSERTSAACQSPDGSVARPPRLHSPLEFLVIRGLSVSSLFIYFFFLHVQQLKMRWHFNSTTKSPSTYSIYLKELITSLSGLFPSPPHLNNQGRSNTVWGKIGVKLCRHYI